MVEDGPGIMATTPGLLMATSRTGREEEWERGNYVYLAQITST